MVSYEVSIGFVIITVLLFAGSLNLSEIVRAQDDTRRCFDWYWLPLFPMLISSSSRRWPRPTARPSICWKRNPNWWPASSSNIPRRPYLLFLLGEYMAIVLHVRPDHASCSWAAGCRRYISALHLGAGHHLVPAQGCFLFFMFAMVKAIVPRYRYDQLMRLGWKVFLPMSLALVVIVAGVRAVRRLCRATQVRMP